MVSFKALELLSAGLGLVGLLFKVLYGTAGLAVFLADVVEEFLDAEHVAVVGEGNAGHAVGHGFVDQGVDRCLAVEHGVLRVDVEVCEHG